MKHLISISNISRQEIEELFQVAEGVHQSLSNKVLCSLYFEPSTRTRLSFEAAALKLGMNVLGTENAILNSSSAKGESIEDTIKVIGSYADIIILRHPDNDAAIRAATISNIPIVNAGCGSNEHPTQTLIDLFTIKKRLGKLDNLTVGFVGDIKNSRTIHSLGKALKLFSNVKILYFANHGLDEPSLGDIQKNAEDLESSIGELDVLYLTREQKEKGSSTNSPFVLSEELANRMKPNSIILHPLPRNEELPAIIDTNPRAAYFDQANNAISIRMAIIQKLLVKSVELVK